MQLTAYRLEFIDVDGENIKLEIQKKPMAGFRSALD